MRSVRFALILLLPLAILASWSLLRAPSPADPRMQHRAREVARLRAHFDSVDVELRSEDSARLSPAQRAARNRVVEWLRDYRNAGAFPQNDRFADRPMPFFRDGRGTPCAMAYLIDRSGRRDVVERIARTQNDAFIAQLSGDPDLCRWLEGAGLTVSEAARIQPQYSNINLNADETVSADYALTSMVVSGASLTTVGLNAFAPSKATSWAGLIAGGAGMIAGLANLGGTSGEKMVATANMIAGGTALGAGLYRLFTVRAPNPAANLARPGVPTRVEFAIVPSVDAVAQMPEVKLILRGTF